MSYNEYRKPKSSLKVPVLADKRLQIQFSEAIVEAFKLRKEQPTGYLEKIAEIRLQQRELFDKIESGEVEVACWTEGYSLEDRVSELEALKEELLLEDMLDLESEINFEEDVDNDEFDDIFNELDNFEEEVL
ncbi:hypothetical protein [Pseudoalteromonas phage PH357]|nr:hypothetical protein [Pseudoalteromonas phage PH357]